MAQKIELELQVAGGAQEDSQPLTGIRKILGDGREIAAIPITLVGGITFSMLDPSMYGAAKYEISVYDALAYYSP